MQKSEKNRIGLSPVPKMNNPIKNNPPIKRQPASKRSSAWDLLRSRYILPRSPISISSDSPPFECQKLASCNTSTMVSPAGAFMVLVSQKGIDRLMSDEGNPFELTSELFA